MINGKGGMLRIAELRRDWVILVSFSGETKAAWSASRTKTPAVQNNARKSDLAYLVGTI